MAVLYILIATAMFYLYQGNLTFGGFGFMYYYLLGMGIAAIAFVSFLVKPKVHRAVGLAKEAATLSLAYLLPLLISLFIWVFSFSQTRMMTRGFFFVVYQMIALVVAMSTVYLFGNKGLRYCLLSMLLANGLLLLKRIGEFGIGVFLQELLDLVLSFGMDTGTMMRSMEIHDLTFALGLFFLYDLIEGRKRKLQPLYMLVTLFFLLVGLKRIGMIAIAVPFVVVLLLKRFSEKTAKSITMVICYGVISVCFVYLVAVSKGLFVYLEETLQIDTKGRMDLYRVVNTFYELAPSYFGRGLGFSSAAWNSLGIETFDVWQQAYHNEYLRMYVEVGFWGFLGWMWLLLPYRVNYFWKKKGMMGGLVALALVLYCCITYATDNTLYYYYTNTALFMLVLGQGIEKQEGEQHE